MSLMYLFQTRMRAEIFVELYDEWYGCFSSSFLDFTMMMMKRSKCLIFNFRLIKFQLFNERV